MAEQVTEQTYASDLKEWINNVISSENLVLSYAKVEMSKDKKWTDILVFDKQSNCILIIEVKRPHISPSDPLVKSRASDYAKQHNARYFATHLDHMSAIIK